MSEDPLEELLLDADEVDRAQLAQVLSGIVGIDNASGRVVLRPGFNGLDSKGKLLAFLMGAKVAALLGKADNEVVMPSELSSQTGMPKGTVNPTLSQLFGQRMVSKTKSGGYFIEPHHVLGAISVLRARGGDDG